jgi:hypothetical protein
MHRNSVKAGPYSLDALRWLFDAVNLLYFPSGAKMYRALPLARGAFPKPDTEQPPYSNVNSKHGLFAVLAGGLITVYDFLPCIRGQEPFHRRETGCFRATAFWRKGSPLFALLEVACQGA